MLDYMFMGQTDEGTMPTLAIKDKKTKRPWGTVIERKGDDPFAIKFLADAIRETGYKRVVLKSDDEVAILALKTKAGEQLTD
eukprot:1108595-Pyramimonas_sp.AAC.1